MNRTGISQNPWSLAVETSGRIGSVALAHGATVKATRSFSAHLRHAVELLPTVDQLCRQADITPVEIGTIHVSAGPGSFTGLRIGITFAKSLAYATGAAVVCVPTLEVIAQNALDLEEPPPRVAVLLDAKRSNVFASTFNYRDGGYEALDQPLEREPRSYLESLAPLAVLGEGLEIHRDGVRDIAGLTFPEPIVHAARAEMVHCIGHRLAAAGTITPLDALLPVYVRRPEAEERWEARARENDRL